MGYFLSRVWVALWVTAVITLAGPNKAAELFIDCAPASPSIDSLGMCVAESSFVAGIVVRNARKVYSYQYSIVFDTSRLQFVKAIKGNADCPNFLESYEGQISFKGTMEVENATRILIAGWLSGDDTSQCADGDGTLALVTFRKRANDTASLSLTKIIVIDCNLDEDTACVTHGAKVVPGTMDAHVARKNAARREEIEFTKGMIRLRTQSGREDCRATISDISGREIQHFSRGSKIMEADMRSMARGIYFISIMHGNRISSYPLAVGR
jgi:hypothetical protein